MNRLTALIIVVLALAIGGYLFWTGRDTPAEVPGASPEAPATEVPAPEDGAPPIETTPEADLATPPAATDGDAAPSE